MTGTTLAQLDAQARAQQAQNAAAVATFTLTYWLSQGDEDNLAVSSQDWLERVIQAILRGRQDAYRIAVAYATAVRNIQAPTAPPFTAPPLPEPPREQLVKSLSFTGPREAAIALAKVPEPMEPPPTATESDRDRYAREREQWRAMRRKAMENAGAKAAAAAYRHTQNGGRDTIDMVVKQDPVALGYTRITKGNPCAFCLMLASRGPVYSEDSFDRSDPRFTGPGEHKVHDACGCSLRPNYKRGRENWTDQALQADEVWRQMLKDNPGISGKKAVNKYASITRQMGIADLTRW